MPRPRFHRLSVDQQQAVLRAALEEFSAHGFYDASLNRVIEAAGISKGSMYYYFDDKEDLYAHVVRVELGRLFDGIGPFPVPAKSDPHAFWSMCTESYLRIVRALDASPAVAALARGWITVSTSPALRHAQREMEEALLPWFAQALAAGQRANAIRTDLPESLLIAVVFGMGRAMDTWLLAQPRADESLHKLVPTFIGMVRNAISPIST